MNTAIWLVAGLGLGLLLPLLARDWTVVVGLLGLLAAKTWDHMPGINIR